jgi:hypothetical protein
VEPCSLGLPRASLLWLEDCDRLALRPSHSNQNVYEAVNSKQLAEADALIVIAGMGTTLRSIVMTGDPGLAVGAAHRQEQPLKEVIDHFPTMLRLSSADSPSGRSAVYPAVDPAPTAGL